MGTLEESKELAACCNRSSAVCMRAYQRPAFILWVPGGCLALILYGQALSKISFPPALASLRLLPRSLPWITKHLWFLKSYCCQSLSSLYPISPNPRLAVPCILIRLPSAVTLAPLCTCCTLKCTGKKVFLAIDAFVVRNFPSPRRTYTYDKSASLHRFRCISICNILLAV